MRRIGIMGGTFNPIHNGHLAIAERARDQFFLEKVLFVPSGLPYMKDQRKVLPAAVRCEMTAIAIADIPGFELSDIEAANPGKNTYTFETLQGLKEKTPDAQFYFILGADSLQAIERWKNPELIFQSCTILAAERREEDTVPKTADVISTDQADGASQEPWRDRLACRISYLREKFNASIEILSLGDIAVSSTQIRRLIGEGESIHGLVPEAVEGYIRHNHLYGNQ